MLGFSHSTSWTLFNEVLDMEEKFIIVRVRNSIKVTEMHLILILGQNL